MKRRDFPRGFSAKIPAVGRATGMILYGGNSRVIFDSNPFNNICLLRTYRTNEGAFERMKVRIMNEGTRYIRTKVTLLLTYEDIIQNTGMHTWIGTNNNEGIT